MRLIWFYWYQNMNIQGHELWRDNSDPLGYRCGLLKTTAISLVAAMLLHPLHVAEARLVLQNRLPNFQTYPRIMNMFLDFFMNKSGGGVANGLPGWFVIVPLWTLGHASLLGVPTPGTVALQTLVFHGAAYPFLTAMRRMEAQVSDKAGMLHGRYANYPSCLYHTFAEEGFKGLYRGFPLYLVAVIISSAVVPSIAEA